MSHSFFHGSRFTVHGLILIVTCLFSHPNFGQSNFIPWCFEATSADFQASQEFKSSIITPAASLNTELSIPLHIIYVNNDNGTPPRNTFRLSKEVLNANTVYDGFLNFYICGFHHINSSDYSVFDFGTERVGLFNTYHVDDAINVYIVSGITGNRSGIAAFPTIDAPNNIIVIARSARDFTLAHEIGHYLGLFHTHSRLYQSATDCFLEPSSTDLDLIPDTPYDPGPNTICPSVCPTAPPCTLTCDQLPTPVTYTYPAYFTDNVMSYHDCSAQRFTDDQVDMMEFTLNNHPTRTFLLNTPPTCNNGISENGFVNKTCQYYTPNPEITPIKDIQIDMKNEVTGWEGDRKETEPNGEYLHFDNDYSNLSEVIIEPRTSHPNTPMILLDPTSVPWNYNPINGVTTADIVLIGKHILGIAPLQPPYSFIAADVNSSGSITTFDNFLIRKIVLGIDADFPSGTWNYVPEHYFKDFNFNIEFPLMPFTATYAGLGYPFYMDRVVLDMDDVTAADPNSWSFRAIKMGDVDCTMTIDNGLVSSGGEGLVTSGSTGSECVQNNDVITIEVKGSASQPVEGYQLGMQYDQNKLQYLGSSAGNITDYSSDNFNVRNGEIKTMWNKFNFQPESMETQKTLFKLHFKALNSFCGLTGVFNLNEEVLPATFYNFNVAPMAANIELTYQKQTPTGNLISLYPNPTTNSATFSFLLNQPGLVTIRLSDYLGGTLNMNQTYNAGTFTYTFPSLSSLVSGPLNYTIQIGNLTYSGVLVKSQP